MITVNRIWLKALAFVLIALTVFLPIDASNEETFETVVQLESYAAGAPVTRSNYYGRGALAALENSEALLYAYDKIAEGVEASTESISLYNGNRYLSTEELSTVLDAYTRDYSEHFWRGNEYTLTTDAYGVRSIKMTYLISGSALVAARDAFDEAISAMIIGITPQMTDFEKEEYLHDALARRVEYREGTNAHNAYGALVEGVSVCEGYAEALQCLLRSVGIEGFLAYGRSYNPNSLVSEAHAWNYVKIDGNFYHTDLTWNDQGSNIFHAYFNLSDSQIGVDHVLDSAAYALPTCNSNIQNYFNVKGGVFNCATYNVETVAARMLASGGRESFYITDGVAAFTEWFDDNARDIADEMRVYGSLTYGFTSIGNEVIVTMNYCKHASLTRVAPLKNTCITPGNVEYYVCDSCQRYFENATATEEIPDKDSVSLLPKGHTYSERIFDSSHIKVAASDCKSYDVYWYDCTDCDSISSTKFYVSDNAGPHDNQLLKGDSNGHYEQCKKCFKNGPVSLHLPNIAAPTDTEAVLCTECGYIITPSLAHTQHTPKSTWTHDSDSHWRSCMECEEQRFDLNSHVFDNSCDNRCDVCSYERVTEHSFTTLNKNANSHWKECTCGERGEPEAHADADADKKCDTCGYDLLAADMKSKIFEVYEKVLNKLAEYGITPPIIIVGSSGLLLLIIILSKISKRKK